MCVFVRESIRVFESERKSESAPVCVREGEREGESVCVFVMDSMHV